MRTRFALVLLALVLTSCSWGRYDRRHTYLHAENIPEVKVPASLDKPKFEDAMVIPPVNDSRDIAGKPVEVGLPQSFSTTYGVDKIVIKKLGDTRWVFLDAPPATVWPKVSEYWEGLHIPLVSSDPSKGVMETRWLYAKGGDAKAIYQSIKNGTTSDDPDATTQQKFRLRIEPGIRAGSTEIYLKERSVPAGLPAREQNIDWSGKSDDNAVEGAVLTDIAYYLGEHINSTYTVSKGAESIGGEKAQLFPDPVKPVLTYRLPFDRTWATVGDALKTAKIKVIDMDRDAADYYVYYDQNAKRGKPGFLSRLLFRHGAADDKNPAHRYVVHLDNKNGKAVDVTVMKDHKTLATAAVAEQLLKIIKENST